MARRRFNPTPRRKKVWADLKISTAGFAEDVHQTNDLLADFVTNGGSTQGVTVLRTIITASWLINEAHTAQDSLVFGFIKGTKTAADAADVDLEPYADWAWHDTSWAGYPHGLVTADVGSWYRADVHSMRKINEVGETWWLVYKGSAPTTATATYDIRARVRTLLLLP